MKRKMILSCFIAICVLWCFSSLAFSDDDDLDEGNILSVPSSCPTIQSAVDAANPGDTIVVDQGEYTGAVVNKSVKIIGRGRATRIVYPCEKYWSTHTPVGFWIEADNVMISHCSIEGIDMGIFGENVEDVIISGLIISDTKFGIAFVNCKKWSVLNNRISDIRESGFVYPAVGIALEMKTENCLIAFNRISAPANVPTEGILFYTWPTEYDPRTVRNNKVIFNKISVGVAGHSQAGAITLIDGVYAYTGADSSEIRDNVIKFNDLSGNEVTLLYLPPELENLNCIMWNKE
jgi:hypothetical protein